MAVRFACTLSRSKLHRSEVGVDFVGGLVAKRCKDLSRRWSAAKWEILEDRRLRKFFVACAWLLRSVTASNITKQWLESVAIRLRGVGFVGGCILFEI